MAGKGRPRRSGAGGSATTVPRTSAAVGVRAVVHDCNDAIVVFNLVIGAHDVGAGDGGAETVDRLGLRYSGARAMFLCISGRDSREVEELSTHEEEAGPWPRLNITARRSATMQACRAAMVRSEVADAWSWNSSRCRSTMVSWTPCASPSALEAATGRAPPLSELDSAAGNNPHWSLPACLPARPGLSGQTVSSPGGSL